ncbi:MAG: hypothetical protein B7Z75_12250 [Acidocella sp. 20-57-95]|nr:MAG: hypothetical protein B7Z75_12250 [Acidocella sp. 20-57-95]HQT65307.1 Flp family type IVb pilin [Acidocella sp.]
MQSSPFGLKRRKFASATNAVTAIEYALIAALIAVVIVVGVSAVASSASGTFTAASNGFSSTGSSGNSGGSSSSGQLGSLANPYIPGTVPVSFGGNTHEGNPTQCGSVTCYPLYSNSNNQLLGYYNPNG